MATRALLFGMFVGAVVGLAFGFDAGYSQSDGAVVLPLTKGIEV